MKISIHTGGIAQTNGYLVTTEEGSLAIDAPLGMLAHCQSEGILPDGLLLTHQHFDHVEDAAVMQAEGIPIYAAAPYSPQLTLEEGARQMGLPIQITPYQVDHLLSPHTTLRMQGLNLDLLPLPGHSPDSFVFHVALFQKLFAGDTVFAGSIGRTDLPGGDHELLLRGIREVILPLSGETQILPGHGPDTTVNLEAAHNPFLA